MLDELRRENAELRQTLRELILTGEMKKSLWPSQEGCPVLDLPHPCACGNVIIERFLFAPDSFKLTIAENSMKVEGSIKEVSLHDIDYRDKNIVCRKCGRKFVRKWELSSKT